MKYTEVEYWGTYIQKPKLFLDEFILQLVKVQKEFEKQAKYGFGEKPKINFDLDWRTKKVSIAIDAWLYKKPVDKV